MKKIALVLLVAFLAMTTVQAQEKPVKEKKVTKTMAAKCEHKKGEKCSNCSKCEDKGKEAKKDGCEKPCDTEKKAEKNDDPK
jgi:hypothetical protein